MRFITAALTTLLASLAFAKWHQPDPGYCAREHHPAGPGAGGHKREVGLEALAVTEKRAAPGRSAIEPRLPHFLYSPKNKDKATCVFCCSNYYYICFSGCQMTHAIRPGFHFLSMGICDAICYAILFACSVDCNATSKNAGPLVDPPTPTATAKQQSAADIHDEF